MYKYDPYTRFTLIMGYHTGPTTTMSIGKYQQNVAEPNTKQYVTHPPHRIYA